MRLMVDSTNTPLGLSRVKQALIIDCGSGTCSSISIQVTTSNSPACALAKSSTATQAKSIAWLVCVAWICAALILASPKSIPVTVAPRTAMLCDKIPPPQPTSNTFLPVKPDCWRAMVCCSIQFKRSGLIWCKVANAPDLSHHSLARSVNFCTSCKSTFCCRFGCVMMIVPFDFYFAIFLIRYFLL